MCVFSSWQLFEVSQRNARTALDRLLRPEQPARFGIINDKGNAELLAQNRRDGFGVSAALGRPLIVVVDLSHQFVPENEFLAGISQLSRSLSAASVFRWR